MSRPLACLLLLSACGGPTAPAPQPAPPPPQTTTESCTFEIAEPQRTHAVGPQGGVIEIAVSTGCACSVDATSQSEFLIVRERPPSRGDTLIHVLVLPNTGPERTGSLTVGGHTIEVSQRAAGACALSVSPDRIDTPQGGGDATIRVSLTQGSGCDWTASSSASFIAIVSGASGRDAGEVVIRVAANTGESRAGIVSVAGQDVRVDQSGTGAPAPAACAFAVTPIEASVTAAAQTVEFQIAVTNGSPTCAWTVQTTSPFLAVNGPISGEGSGSVRVDVAANSGAARTGTLTIAGLVATVRQASPGACVTGLSLSNTTFPAGGGSAVATVAARADCSWTPVAEGGFFSVDGGARTGPGTFTVSVSSNPSSANRSGRVRAGEEAVTLFQSAAVTPPQPPPGITTYFSLLSQQGDNVGRGQTRLDTPANAVFSATATNNGNGIEILIYSSDGTSWGIYLNAPAPQSLTPGVYEPVGSIPGAISRLAFFGDGRACNDVTGRFQVHQAVFGPSGTVERFAASFEQHCEGFAPAALGEIVLLAPFTGASLNQTSAPAGSDPPSLPVPVHRRR